MCTQVSRSGIIQVDSQQGMLNCKPLNALQAENLPTVVRTSERTVSGLKQKMKEIYSLFRGQFLLLVFISALTRSKEKIHWKQFKSWKIGKESYC